MHCISCVYFRQHACRTEPTPKSRTNNVKYYFFRSSEKFFNKIPEALKIEASGIPHTYYTLYYTFITTTLLLVSTHTISSTICKSNDYFISHILNLYRLMHHQNPHIRLAHNKLASLLILKISLQQTSA